MSNIRKKLVILTPGFAKDESDTTCLPMQQSFVRCLNKMFPHIDVVILAVHYPYFKKRYQWFGNTVISFNGRNRGGISKLLLWRKCLLVLRKIHRETKIDGVLSFWYSDCAFIGKRFANKYAVRHCCWMWGQDAKKNNRYASLGFMKANELIAFSDFLQEEFEKNYGVRPEHVITPGIDVNEFPVPAKEKDVDIVAAGSLIPLKQYDVLIRVIGEISRTVPHVKAILIGDGPEKERLQSLIRSSRLETNISLVGELPHPEVLQWMQRGKIFLHSSSYEGFGIVCIEALCAGAEVISFSKPMRQVIEKWHNVIDENEMAQKAISLLKNEGVYKSVVPFTIEQTTQRIGQLFSF